MRPGKFYQKHINFVIFVTTWICVLSLSVHIILLNLKEQSVFNVLFSIKNDYCQSVLFCRTGIETYVIFAENPDLLDAQRLKNESLHQRLHGMVVNPDKVPEVSWEWRGTFNSLAPGSWHCGTLCVICNYSTGVQIVSCTLSDDSVLSESTGLCNPVLCVSQ